MPTETSASPTLHPDPVVTLPSDREIQITRTFRARPEQVFAAWTQPEHVRRWWGSPEAPLVVCEIDLQVGGRWRYVSQDSASGQEFGWHGTYREVAGPHRLVSTEVFEGFPDAEAIDTLTLTADGELTRVQIQILHASKENRDGHVNSGMEAGMRITLARLDDVLAGLGGQDNSPGSPQ